jgi:hypothetical protein
MLRSLCNKRQRHRLSQHLVRHSNRHLHNSPSRKPRRSREPGPKLGKLRSQQDNKLQPSKPHRHRRKRRRKRNRQHILLYCSHLRHRMKPV